MSDNLMEIVDEYKTRLEEEGFSKEILGDYTRDLVGGATEGVSEYIKNYPKVAGKRIRESKPTSALQIGGPAAIAGCGVFIGNPGVTTVGLYGTGWGAFLLGKKS